MDHLHDRVGQGRADERSSAGQQRVEHGSRSVDIGRWSYQHVAKEAVELLKALQVEPARTKFFGESFGNWVNARIAEALGGRGRILAFNPPNDLSGYKTPDLRFCSDVAWSFQTYPLCDCQSPIADVGFFLETPANAKAKDQHVFGVACQETLVTA